MNVLGRRSQRVVSAFFLDLIWRVHGTHTEEDVITPSQEIMDIPEVVPTKPMHSKYMDVVNVNRLYTIFTYGPDMETAHTLSLQLRTPGQ